MNKTKLTVLILAVGLLASCSYVGKVASIGASHKISLYSGGVLVQSWESEGKVINEKGSDGYYFTTKDGRYVEVSGTVVIERDNL